MQQTFVLVVSMIFNYSKRAAQRLHARHVLWLMQAIKAGHDEGDAYRHACDIVLLVLNQDEMDDPDFKEALYLRKIIK